MKLVSWIPVLLVGAVFTIAVAGGGSKYEEYQTRELSNSLRLHTDLTAEEIDYLLELPRTPALEPLEGDSVVFLEEWLMIRDDGSSVGHFKGCRGRMLFDLSTKK